MKAAGATETWLEVPFMRRSVTLSLRRKAAKGPGINMSSPKATTRSPACAPAP